MAEITSANVVGYRTEALTDGNYNMIAVSFNGVDGEGIDLNGSGITINNHSVTEEPYDDGTDYIQIWNPVDSGYAEFYYSLYDEAWVSADGSYTPFIECEGFESGLPAGATAWYIASNMAEREGDLSMTVAGAVADDADTTILASDNFNMVASPYPVAVDFNNPETVVIQNHSITEEPFDDGTDYIQIWDPVNSGYAEFYYSLYDEAWVAADGSYTPFNETAGFEDGLPVGVAFWYNASADAVREGDLSITFKKTF